MKDTKRWLLFLLILCLISVLYLEYDAIWETIIGHYKAFIIGVLIISLITALGIKVLFIFRKKIKDYEEKIQYIQTSEDIANTNCRIEEKTSNDELLLLVHKYETTKEKDNKNENK